MKITLSLHLYGTFSRCTGCTSLAVRELHGQRSNQHRQRRLKFALIGSFASLSGAALALGNNDQQKTRIFSLMELAEMCARGRIVIAYQVS